MPLDGMRLTIEPTYPRGKELAEIGRKPDDDEMPAGLIQRNVFYSRRRQCDVYIWNEPDGTLKHGLVPCVHGLKHQLNTLFASRAWGIEQESNALQLLGTLIRHHHFKSYLLTGMFMETSKRSGLTYIFRKLRPTVVIDAREGEQLDYDIGDTKGTWGSRDARIVCTLCLHPIAYYSESWAGAMCPTDDVIAHLMLMRGDEPMLWRRANQHAPYRPESGL